MRDFLILLFVLCGGFIGVAHACTTNEIDVLGDGSQCETAKFTITTTELSADTAFKFYMSASGTFYVDWGDGVVDTITRTDTTETLYDHTYTTVGVKTIRFGGMATGYSSNGSISTSIDAAIRFGYGHLIGSGYESPAESTPQLIETIDGSLGAIFPTLPVGKPKFIMTFASTEISTIPANLFRGVTGSSGYMFAATFATCSRLTSIPENLFSGISGTSSGLFRGTFYNCTSLTSIPPHLFADVTETGHYTFFGTFNICRSLSGYIPPSTFAGLIANGSPYDNYGNGMMRGMFSGTNLATTCPAGTVQFITGYESYWDGPVSCVDANLSCGVGEYLPAHWFKCEPCPENHYCPSGGTYQYSETISSGATACSNGLYTPSGMWEAAQCGRILHVGDGFVYLRATKKTTPSVNIDLDHDGVADYFGNMTTLDVPMSRGTQRKLKVRYDNTTYSVYDDSVDLGLYENE